VTRRRVVFALMATAAGLVPFGLVTANADTAGWTTATQATVTGRAAATFPVAETPTPVVAPAAPRVATQASEPEATAAPASSSAPLEVKPSRSPARKKPDPAPVASSAVPEPSGSPAEGR
jgi:hypothetical protein